MQLFAAVAGGFGAAGLGFLAAAQYMPGLNMAAMLPAWLVFGWLIRRGGGMAWVIAWGSMAVMTWILAAPWLQMAFGQELRTPEGLSAPQMMGWSFGAGLASLGLNMMAASLGGLALLLSLLACLQYYMVRRQKGPADLLGAVARVRGAIGMAPAWLCYIVPPVCILQATYGRGVMVVAAGFFFAVVILTVLAVVAPRGSRLRFHAIQTVLFSVVGVAGIFLMLSGVIGSIGESVRAGGPGAGAAGGMMAIFALVVILGGGSLVFSLIIFFLAYKTWRGRDIRLPGIGWLAAKLARFEIDGRV